MVIWFKKVFRNYVLMVENKTYSSLLIGIVCIEFNETIIFYISHYCDIWECALRPNSTFSPAPHDLVSSVRAQGSFSVTLDWHIQTRSIAKKRSQFKK